MRQIILDTETTGLDPKEGHRIIEIGCVEMIDRQLTGNHYHVYINPDRAIDAGAVAVHGITNQFLHDKPRFYEVAQDFLDYVGEDELVIHNAAFDVGFLDHELSMWKHGWKGLSLRCAIRDTLLMARDKHPGQRNNLDALCKRYGIDNSNRELHGALLDAEILALVYVAMTQGQNSLLLDDDAAQSSGDGTDAVSTTKRNIPVLKATPEEINAHMAYMAKHIAKSSCL